MICLRFWLSFGIIIKDGQASLKQAHTKYEVYQRNDFLMIAYGTEQADRMQPKACAFKQQSASKLQQLQFSPPNFCPQQARMALNAALSLILFNAAKASASSAKQCYGPDYSEIFPFYGIATELLSNTILRH